MEDIIDTDIIKATQVSLGKYVKRPPLSDKLLKKPPFRFLHDIITSVIKTTGFFNGLFEEGELISDNVKDRESKILFLTKVISVIETTTGKSLTVKPSKIVAGQEPDKTNELLQCLAFALDNKLSSDEAVKLYKQPDNTNVLREKQSRNATKPIKKVSDAKKLTSKSTDKLVKTDKNSNKLKQRENSTLKKESPPKKISQTSKIISRKGLEKEKQDSKSNTVNKTNTPNVTSKEPTRNVLHSDSNVTVNILDITRDNQSSIVSVSDVDDTKEINDDCNNLEQKDDSLSQENIVENKDNEITKLEHNERKEDEESKNEINNINESSNNLNSELNAVTDSNLISNNENENLKSQADIIGVDAEAEVEATATKFTDISYVKRPNSVRPSSSRPGAPRFREKNENLLPATENLVLGKVNIIAENSKQEEEEDTSIVIVESIETVTGLQDQADQLQTSNQHGHLVQQILDAQKEFSEVIGKTNLEWQFGAQKTRNAVNQEIEQLRFNVQALSRVANPLGKLLDHIQEDVEVMRQELLQWTLIYEDATKQLLKQKAANEESLLPLHSKVKQLEADISEKHDKINDLKIVIHKNAFRIEKLLTSGNVQ